jgi:ABC-type lipoprotein export system ATPase subunit
VTHEADIAAFAHRTIHLRDGQIEKDIRQAA